MSRKWTDGDSARLMTNKYNETAEEVENLKKQSNEINQATKEVLDNIQKQVDKKLEEVTAEDLGLGEVDNTPDMKKPLSEAQARAIDDAVEPMLTSESLGNIQELTIEDLISSSNK